jgi:UDP-2-acetamido-3-amino-2,3-dideoxy-glucuronate N-acetyltransferase
MRNIAVVGAGYWGKNLARNFAELKALHTICDTNPDILSGYKSLYPDVNLETNFQAILENNRITGVVLATPAVLHYTNTREALIAGKDVFVEKPLALRVDQGEELVELAERQSRILMVGHLLEYHPAVIKMKELIDEGVLGNIEYIYSNRLNLGKFRSDEDILWSFAPHDISVIQLLLDEKPLNVSAHGGYYLHKDIADVTVTTMSFNSGVKAHIFVNWLHPYKEQKLVVVGDARMLVFDDVTSNNKLLLFDYKIEWVDRTPVPHRQDPTSVKFSKVEPLKVECQHFLESIKSRQKPKTDGADGLRVLQILDACQSSLRSGGAIVTLGQESRFFKHESSIVENTSLVGEGTKIWHFCHIMPGAIIGKDCTIGQNVFVGENAHIGNNVKIENNVSIFSGVTLEDDVFCGPSCVFTNVKAPRSFISQKGNFQDTVVGKGATIGANATIIATNKIGRYSFIGAGAVVTKDVPDYALVYGNPAMIHGWVCECGKPLNFKQNRQFSCSNCGKEYEQHSNKEVIQL